MSRTFGVLVAALAATALASSAQAMIIVPTFNNSAGQTWTPAREAVINQAISDWESVITDNFTLDITFDFRDAGVDGYLGLTTSSYSGVFVGDTVTPESSHVVRAVHFNADLMTASGTHMDFISPSDTVPFNVWDALSVARHELGHVLGFADGTYYTDVGDGSNAVDLWTSHIQNTIFDSAGLDVPMAASDNLSHVKDAGTFAGDLMVPALPNGVRRDISQTDASMLALAYGYAENPVPEPASVGLLAVGAVVLLRRRRTA